MTVDVVLVLTSVQLNARKQLFLNIRCTGGSSESWQPVFVGNDAIESYTRWELAWPTNETWNAESTFPVRILLAMEWRGSSIWPSVVVRTIVGRIQNDGIFGEP